MRENKQQPLGNLGNLRTLTQALGNLMKERIESDETNSFGEFENSLTGFWGGT